MDAVTSLNPTRLVIAALVGLVILDRKSVV